MTRRSKVSIWIVSLISIATAAIVLLPILERTLALYCVEHHVDIYEWGAMRLVTLGDASVVRPLLILRAPYLTDEPWELRNEKLQDPVTLALVVLSRQVPFQLAQYAYSQQEDPKTAALAKRVLATLGSYHLWNGDKATIEYLVGVYLLTPDEERCGLLYLFMCLLKGTGSKFRPMVEPVVQDGLTREATRSFAEMILKVIDSEGTPEHVEKSRAELLFPIRFFKDWTRILKAAIAAGDLAQPSEP
jgi:hypothetical protein